MSDLSMGFDDMIGSAPASFAAADQPASAQKSATSFFKKITAKHLLFIAALLGLFYVLYRYWPRKQPVVKTEDELLANETSSTGGSANSSSDDPLVEAHRVVERNMRKAKPGGIGAAKKAEEAGGIEEEEENLSKPTGPKNNPPPPANARLPQNAPNLQQNAANQSLLQSQVHPPPELNLGMIAASGGMNTPLVEMMEKVQLKQKVEHLTAQIGECKQGVADTNKGLRAVRGLIQESHNIIVQQIQQHINLQQQQFQHLQFQQQQQQQSMRRSEPSFYPTLFPSPTAPPLSPFLTSPQAVAAAEAATAEYREQQKMMREVQKERNRGKEREVERRGDREEGDKGRGDRDRPRDDQGDRERGGRH